jgi:hypothetical protein
MIQLIILMIFVWFGQPTSIVKMTSDKNFDLVEDFEKNKAMFRSDEFDLSGHSTEGGQLTAFHNKDKAYLVFDIWTYGEMGKIHATYWTDKDLNFKIVKRTDFEYDKPFYEKDFKVTEKTEYLSYNSDKMRIYDSERKELGNSLSIEKKKEYEEFFQEITNDLKIVK